MHIAYLINQYPKVSHSFIRREILALERQGITVSRIALRGWDEELVDEEDKAERKITSYILQSNKTKLLASTLNILLRAPRPFFKALGLALSLKKHSGRPLHVYLAYLVEACEIALRLRSTNVQHIHAHFGTNSAAVGLLVHRITGKSWSFTAHGPEEFDKIAQFHLAKKVVASSFSVAVSSFGRGQLYRIVDPEHWGKIHVVHCGIDRKFLEQSPTPLNSRRLVCVGRLCEQKGQLLLLEAARRLLVKGLDFEILLAGDGEHRDLLNNIIRKHGLTERVRITGWISADEVRDVILNSRALVLPSLAEGLPVVIMEAMALHRPVISTYIAGIPELVIPGKHGWLVPSGDIDSLVTAIQECLQASPEIISDMGSLAHHRVAERHNIDVEASKLAVLFREAIAAN